MRYQTNLDGLNRHTKLPIHFRGVPTLMMNEVRTTSVETISSMATSHCHIDDDDFFSHTIANLVERNKYMVADLLMRCILRAALSGVVHHTINEIGNVLYLP